MGLEYRLWLGFKVNLALMLEKNVRFQLNLIPNLLNVKVRLFPCRLSFFLLVYKVLTLIGINVFGKRQKPFFLN